MIEYWKEQQQKIKSFNPCIQKRIHVTKKGYIELLLYQPPQMTHVKTK